MKKRKPLIEITLTDGYAIAGILILIKFVFEVILEGSRLWKG